MKTNRLLLAAALALVALAGLVLAFAWAGATARAEEAMLAPAAPQSLPPPWLGDANAADAPYGASPTVDGRIAPGEYAGAGKVAFPGYGGVEVFFREDGSYLYVAFDFADQQTSGAAAQVFLDTNHDGGSLPQTDDYRLSITRNGSTLENQGTGSGWGSHTVPISWTAATTLTISGWQAEFRIQYAKMGLTPGTFKVMGLSLINAWTPGGDYYWPHGAFWANPSTWGHLTSSSDWGTFYWKPGPWEDYAPSGLPDFDQMQVGPAYCGPFAAASSLWWFDSKFEQRPVGPLPGGPPSTVPISDSYTLVSPYGPWDDHDPQNVASLAQDLGNNYFGTSLVTGTHVYSMYYGIQRYLRDHGLWDDYIVTLVNKPDFNWIAEEVMRSEDVILLLGFWEWLDLGPDGIPGTPDDIWQRVGGHFVTVAGVDSQMNLIAFSDPSVDNAEGGNPGRVLSGTLLTHYPPHPGFNPPVHNDAGNVSHDIYLKISTASPGGTWGPDGYPWKDFVDMFGANPHPHHEFPTEPWHGMPVQVEVEFALAVSPFDWKASGEWLPQGGDPVQGIWQPWVDYAPNGVPDFDQQQDNWGQGGPPPIQWTFCGPVAAANSLWWFDSKFERQGAVPPTTSDTYPLVRPYGAWDDHDPQNMDRVGTIWPPPGWPVSPPIQQGNGELVEDLALYFLVDQPPGIGSGTLITDMYNGLQQYLTDHSLRQGYVISQVQRPEFWWVAEEVERSEDVILLLGFWEWVDPSPAIGDEYWERVGGHYVTVPGVDKAGGFVAFSDPYWDRMETRLPPNEFAGQPLWTGRVGSDGDPPLGATGLVPAYTHTPLPHTGVYTLHNDAANVSHDVYRVVNTISPGGTWGPQNYVTTTSQIVNFRGLNGGGTYTTGLPVTTEVEWAVAVSPVADVYITKTVTPATVRHGDHITFTITFSNGGSLPAEGVVITDSLPSQLAGSSWSAWLSNGGSVTARGGTPYVWDVADLAWSDWGIITVTGQISATDLNLGVINAATIGTSSVEQYQITPLANTASVPFTIQNPDIGVTPASLSVTLAEGTSATRFITISNTGGAALTWSLAESPSAGWLSETPTGGSVALASSTLVTVTFTTTGLSAGAYTTTLRISSDDPDENPVDVPVTLTVPPPDIDVTPAALAETLPQGASATRIITIANTGQSTLSWALSETPSVGWLTELPTNGNISWGSDAQVVVTFTAGSAGVYTTTLRITSNDPDENPVDVPVSLTVNRYGVDLQPASASLTEGPNKTVTYTLVLYNTGSVADTYDITGTISNLAWTTNWPATVGPVASGGSAQFNVTVQIPGGATSGQWSQAVITATSQGDPGKGDASTLTTYAQSGDITHGVQVVPSSPTVSGDPGSTVCFTLTVTNTGNVTDTVSVVSTFPVSWTVDFTPPPPYVLGPGQSQVVQVCIAIPAGAGGGSTEVGGVTVGSQGDPNASIDVDVTVHVGWRFIYLPLVLRNYP